MSFFDIICMITVLGLLLCVLAPSTMLLRALELVNVYLNRTESDLEATFVTFYVVYPMILPEIISKHQRYIHY